MSFKEFIDNQTWIFAKTYAEKAPHEYIVRDKINGTDDDFVNAVMYIREKGFKANFWKKEHIYLFIDGMFYWTMGDPIKDTVIINRCKADDYNLSFYTRRKD